MIYTHNKKDYAIGLAWSEHVSMAAARSFIKAEHKPYVLAESAAPGAEFDTVASGCFQDTARLKRRTFSAAMAVGFVEPNAIICQSLADGKIWFAAVQAGIPFAGYDKIVEQEEAEALLKEQMAYMDSVIGDVTGAKMTLDEALHFFDSQVSDGRITKEQIRAIELHQPSSVTKVLLQAGLAVSILLAAGAGWYVYQTQLRTAADRAAALSRLTKTQEEGARLEAERQRLIVNFNRQVQEQQLLLRGVQDGPQGQWIAWEAVRKSLPVTLNGYVPESMDCVPRKCIVTWRAEGPGVRFVDRAALPNWVDDPEPTTTARSEFAVPPLAVSVRTDQGRDAQALRMRLSQLLQYSVEGASIGPPVALVVRPPAAPPETGLKQADLGFTGDVRIGLGGDLAIVKVAQAITLLATAPVALKSVHWTQLATTSPSVSLEGYWAFANSAR